jgi:nitroimidazol reductase NimA-like FMN-containing flavoprotein (pyridoxamine 5'-phosphate oxidase superfamily)
VTAMDADQGQHDPVELETLDAEACWRLVRTTSVGRFAVNRHGSCPLVVPVNFVVDGEAVVFRTGAGAKLDAAQIELVALQVDEIDPIHHTGWSVLIEGRARWLDEEQDTIAIETWAPGDRPYVIRLAPTRITGRRIRLHQADTDARGYR